MTLSDNSHEIPLHAKMIMIFQSLIILFFGFSMYEEYQYNAYFQWYVNGFINENGAFLIMVLAGLGFVITGLGMFTKSQERP